MYYVYKIIDNEIDEVVYIGVTSKKRLKTRLTEHAAYKRTAISKYIRQKGKSLFSIQMIEAIEDRALAFESENKWIKYYYENGASLLNRTAACGFKPNAANCHHSKGRKRIKFGNESIEPPRKHKYIIYELVNSDGIVFYVGQTSRRLSERLSHHKYKRKIKSITARVIDGADTSQEAIAKENYWIEFLSAIHGTIENKKRIKFSLPFNMPDFQECGSVSLSVFRDKTQPVWEVCSPRGQAHPCSKRKGALNKVSKPVICMDNGVVFDNARCAGEYAGVSESSIKQCIRRKSKTSGGFRWMFLSEYKKIGLKAIQDSKEVSA